MRSLLPALLLLGLGCRPVDRERLVVREDGIRLEVVSTSDRDQPHLRRFSFESDPPAELGVRCVGKGLDDEVHERRTGTRASAELPLFGLLADQAYRCTLSATIDDREASGTLSFTTEPGLALPGWTVTGDGGAWGEWTLFNTWVAGNGGRDHWLIAVDGLGRPRWAAELGDDTAAGLEAAPVDRHTLRLGGAGIPPREQTLDGEVRWSFPEVDDGFWHHEAAPTPHGTLLGLRAVDNTDGARTWEGFRVEEYGRDGALRWSWDSQEAYDAGLLPRFAGEGDPWHANAVQWVDDPDGAWVSVGLPRKDRVLALDVATGALRWQVGRGLLLGPAGQGFSGQHDPEWTADGRLLLHDNGTAVGRSRVAEYAVDPEAGTVEELWEWSEPDWFEPLWGDADRLPDGTVLITRGHCAFCPDSGSGNSRIEVVDPVSGAIRWSLEMQSADQGLYRAERIAREGLFDRL